MPWQRDDVKLVQQMASNGAEPVGSLGYDGPLAALSPERQNLADYFKETVAVVTNPALDRERELEHFSTRALFGRRPSLERDPAGDQRPAAATGIDLPDAVEVRRSLDGAILPDSRQPGRISASAAA